MEEADGRFVNQGIPCISKSLDQPQLILITYNILNIEYTAYILTVRLQIVIIVEEADSRFVNQGIPCISKSLDQPQLILITYNILNIEYTAFILTVRLQIVIIVEEADGRFVNQGIPCISKSLEQPQLILITYNILNIEYTAFILTVRLQIVIIVECL